MDLHEAHNRIIRSFWHKTRKVFVPLTRGEIITRSGVGQFELDSILQIQRLRGFQFIERIKSDQSGSTSYYELTSDGIEYAKGIMK